MDLHVLNYKFLVIYKIILLVNHFLKQINSTANDKLETLEGELKTVKVLLQEKEGVSHTETIQPVIQTSPVKEDCLQVDIIHVILNWED